MLRAPVRAPERGASPRSAPTPQRPPPRAARRARASPRAEAQADEKLGFGYTRQDALLVCVAVPAAGFAMYGALSAAGVGAIQAGNAVLLTLVGGLTLVWTGTYVARVMRKDMTYVKQLDAYEAAVMAKRLEELPPGELERLMEEVESDKAKIAARNAARGGENPLLKRD